MMNLRTLIASTFSVACLCQVATPASAVTLISENFNAAAQGDLVSVVPSFSITSGNVDIVGAGFFDFYPGNGNYLDLNGNQRGQITSSTFSFQAGDTVNLSFNYGRNFGGANPATANFSLGGLLSESIAVSGLIGSPFQTFSRNYTVASSFNGALNFASTNDGLGGIILDNIVLTSIPPTGVPEPTTIPGLLLCGGTALMLRRRLLSKQVKCKPHS